MIRQRLAIRDISRKKALFKYTNLTFVIQILNIYKFILPHLENCTIFVISFLISCVNSLNKYKQFNIQTRNIVLPTL